MTIFLREPATRAVAVGPRAPDAISLQQVSKRYGHGEERVTALDGVSLSIPAGQFTCLVGASGCGKSTLLSVIAGLDRATSGSLAVDGGRTALMFQEPALLPWLNVERNVELPMRLSGVPTAQRHSEVARLLELVHLGGLGHRRPHELSGGMRQRVALARALAQDARILLMDEPFAALDAITRDTLHDELTRIWQETGITILFVTHNVREAVKLGDRLLLFSSRPGRVINDIPIDIPRPRAIETPAVGTLSLEITEQLRREICRHGDD